MGRGGIQMYCFNSTCDAMMTFCLLWSRTYIFPLGVFLLIAQSLASDIPMSIYKTWDIDHDSENNLDSSSILWEKYNCPLIDCALFCGMDASCRSFFHHPSLETCMGSQSYKRGVPGGHAAERGWRYYTQRIKCDGGYIYIQALGLCYKLYSIQRTYNDAMGVCEAESAKLIIIRNEAELQYISNLNKAVQVGSVWLGGRGTDANTLWKWWNGQEVSNSSWYPQNPVADDCVCMIRGKLGPSICTSSWWFLCEKHI